MPWFPKWSSGRFSIFLWSYLSSFLIMFYTSNLRAHLATVDYEKPLDTLESVAENGKRVFIYNAAFKQRLVMGSLRY